MDLARQAEIQKRFVVVSEELSAKALGSGLDVSAEIGLARKHADEIFTLTAAFAQQQAVAIIDGPFAEATERIQGRIDERTREVATASSRALFVMFLLSSGTLALQYAIGRRGEKRLRGLISRLADGISSELEETVASAEKIAAGTLGGSGVARAAGTIETERLQKALANMDHRLTAIISELQLAAGVLAGGAQQVAASAHGLSMGTARQAASMEETTASIQQMASSIAQNAEMSRVTDPTFAPRPFCPRADCS